MTLLMIVSTHTCSYHKVVLIVEYFFSSLLDLANTRAALDPGTVMLSFLVCEDKTVLFLVRPISSDPGLTVFTLPLGEAALRGQVGEFRRLIIQRRAANDPTLVARSQALYDELLGPAEPLLSDSDHILVVPDGPLYLLPFPALMRDSTQYLVELKPLTTVASATVYAALKRERHENDRPIEVAAFGDPRYPASRNSTKTRLGSPG
jgi:CHAT domain-containing protein